MGAATPEDDSKVIKDILLSEIRPFGGPYGNHFFGINKDKVEEVAESIKHAGVIFPIVLRRDPLGRNKYECIAGHTRCEAAKRAGLKLIPARVLELDDDEACYYMATSNHQREDLLPSVKARMFKTKYEAIRKTAGRKKMVAKLATI